MIFKSFLIIVLLSFCLQSRAESNNQQRLDEVRQEIEALNTDLSQKKADKEKLYQQLKQQSILISSLNKKQRQLAQQINSKREEVAQLQQDLGIKEQEQQQQLLGLYGQIRSAYIHAQPSYLKILLSQQDISTLGRSSTYYRYFHLARQQELEHINQTLTDLNTQQHELLTVQSALQSLYEQQQTQQASLQNESDKRAQTLKQIEQSISSQDAQLTALKGEESALQKLLNDLSKRSQQTKAVAPENYNGNAGQRFSQLNGKLPWPIVGKVLARYGSSRNLGKLKWQGIVIDSPSGKDIHASAAGKVVFADWLRGFGLLVIIDHGEQYMTLYGNNDALLKEAGDEVQAGEVIAQSGKQDIRGLAGLYFEIRHKGNPTNPLKWLQQKG